MTIKKAPPAEMPASDTDFAKLVGRSIAARRKALGVGHSQEWLGEQIGLVKQTISRIENGAIAPTIFRLRDIAEALRCSMGELLDVKGPDGSSYAKEVARLVDELPAEQREAIARVVREVVALAK